MGCSCRECLRNAVLVIPFNACHGAHHLFHVMLADRQHVAPHHAEAPQSQLQTLQLRQTCRHLRVRARPSPRRHRRPVCAKVYGRARCAECRAPEKKRGAMRTSTCVQGAPIAHCRTGALHFPDSGMHFLHIVVWRTSPNTSVYHCTCYL
eukprot:3586242-Lingulodinium_polyedra.AAC.1